MAPKLILIDVQNNAMFITTYMEMHSNSYTIDNSVIFAFPSATSEKAPESALRPSFLSTFGMATDQGSKLGLGKNNAIICSYTNYQVCILLLYTFSLAKTLTKRSITLCGLKCSNS